MDFALRKAAVFTVAVTLLSVAAVVLLFRDSLLCIILGVISLGLCIPFAVFCIYGWSTGNGYRWINGPDWIGMNEEQRRFAVSRICLGGILSSVLLCYGILVFAIKWPYGFIAGFVIVGIAIAMLAIPVVRYSKGAKIGNAAFVPRDGQKAWLLAIALTVLMAVPSVMILDRMDFREEVEVTAGEDSVAIKAPMVSETVRYSDITEIRMDADFHHGTRISGYGGSSIHSGTFRNSDLGTYTLAAYSSCDACIVIHTSGGYIAFNRETPEETSSLYDLIRSHM